MKIRINALLKEKLPNFSVIAYTMDVENNKTSTVEEMLKNLKVDFAINEVTSNPFIKETRDAYKTLKKDPSHTRCAVEALVRRVIKYNANEGNSIYSLGDIIDLGNILSVMTLRSVCVVDLEKINNDIEIRIGQPNEVVEAIHRDNINAENLIVYIDDTGIFGSPTSDTLRTSVTDETKSILVMIMCFSQNNLNENEQLLKNLYQKYTNAKNIKKILVE